MTVLRDMTDLRAGMIPAQRRALILDIVREAGGASITQIVKNIGASSSTVRRDLDYLTQHGYLERSHGGATVDMMLRATFEPDHDIGSHVAHAAKAAIGEAAAGMVKSGQSLIFDSSSTVMEAARQLRRRDLELTVVTNDLEIATVLASARRIRVIVPGGTIRPGSFTLAGEPGYDFLEGLNVDLAFMGIHSLAGQRLSETSVDVAAMKKRMIDAARHAIVLIDSSKFEHSSFTSVCSAREVHRVVTDSGIPDAERQALERLGVDVRVVEPGEHP